MNIRTQQLDHQRHRRRVRNERQERLLLQQAGPQIEMIVFFLLEHLGFIEKRSRPPVTSFDQSLDSLFVDCVTHYEEPVLVERLSLRFC